MIMLFGLPLIEIKRGLEVASGEDERDVRLDPRGVVPDSNTRKWSVCGTMDAERPALHKIRKYDNPSN